MLPHKRNKSFYGINHSKLGGGDEKGRMRTSQNIWYSIWALNDVLAFVHIEEAKGIQESGQQKNKGTR